MWVSPGPQHSWMGTGRVGKTLESQAGGILGKGQSCSQDGPATVAEELADNRWVSHSRCVPQVVVILSNLPKYPPHDFP